MKIFVSLFLIPPLYLFPPLWCQCCPAAFLQGTCTSDFSASLMICVCFIIIFAYLIMIFSSNSDAYFCHTLIYAPCCHLFQPGVHEVCTEERSVSETFALLLLLTTTSPQPPLCFLLLFAAWISII